MALLSNSVVFIQCSILNARSQQQNFQLVCITHDEEFVQMLSRTQTMDGTRPEYYWRISREDMYAPLMFLL